MVDKIIIKRKKTVNSEQEAMENFEMWVDFWRKNPHRFIKDYLGLVLYDFQNILLYQMNFYNNFIFVGSRGIAKSTLTLMFCFQRCILYPEQKIKIVAPTKEQAGKFIAKIDEFKRMSPNLTNEIETYKNTGNVHEVKFKNGSWIEALPYGENALGARANIIIVDEYVRTDKAVLDRVFIPMLTDNRKPMYSSLSIRERLAIPKESNKQLYLSSIRGADEWSYKEFEEYLGEMFDGNLAYTTAVIPYQFGVKNGFIDPDIVKQLFKRNEENPDVLLAEFSCIPERGNNSSFYKYSSLSKCQNNVKSLTAMSDEEYITYKDCVEKWKFYQPKLNGEIRILTIDVALIESNNNDNTAMWIIRMIPDGDGYKKIVGYGESMHGINALIQAKRYKQLFYELECDWVVLDVQGAGSAVYDILTQPTYDEERGETYPAWIVYNAENIKFTNRALQVSSNGVPIIYGVTTGSKELYDSHVNLKNMIDKQEISLLQDTDKAIDYFDERYNFAEITNDVDRARILNPFVQTRMFIHEAINLEQSLSAGYIKLKEKSGKRKDRVMSLVYGAYVARQIEDELNQNKNVSSIVDWICFG